MKEILVVGYGSIGKRHTINIINSGYSPFVLTKFPDNRSNVKFISAISEARDIENVIISSPTANHFNDFINVVDHGYNNILIEKPVDTNVKKARKIEHLFKKRKLNVHIAYNMRYLKVFNVFREIIKNQLQDIRLIKIVAGQYLPEWRTGKDYRNSYSSIRDEGGGVDLDLSHELDYMLWLFGYPDSIQCIKRDNLSNLKIDSPDYFKGIYRYNNFIVDIELDYFRKKERSIRVIGENRDIFFIDFINKYFSVNGEDVHKSEYFDFEKSYIDELHDFLGINNYNNLSSLDDGIKVLKLLQLE